MATTTDAQQQIQRARGELSETVEAIADRVAPKKVVARAKENVHEKVEDVKENVKEKVSPARLARKPVDALRRAGQRVMGSTPNGQRHDGPDVAGAARARTRQVTARAGESAAALTARASDSAASLAETARNAPAAAADRVEGNPLAAGVLAAAAGFFAASLLRPTRREAQLVDQAREKLEPYKQQALSAGQETAQEVKRRATEGVRQVTERARSAAEDLKQEASTAARSVSERARDEAEEVKEEAARSARQVGTQAKRAASSVKAARSSGSPTTASTKKAAATRKAPPRSASPAGSAVVAARSTPARKPVSPTVKRTGANAPVRRAGSPA